MTMYRVRFTPSKRTPAKLAQELEELVGQYPFTSIEQTETQVVILVSGRHLATILDALGPSDVSIDPVGTAGQVPPGTSASADGGTEDTA